jgi:type IV secretion system protein VirB2
MNTIKQWHHAITFLACAAAVMLPEMAAAGFGDNPISDTLCAVVGWFTGSVGAGIATLAVIIIGVGALLGKVSWGMAIIVGLGVAIIFGAPEVIDALSPGAGWSGSC